MPSEKSIEKKVVAWAEAHEIYTRKFSSPAHRGVPDRIFIYRGRVAFIEFKKPGGEPTELQYREMRLILGQGVEVFWTRDVLSAIAFLERALRLCV